MKAAGNFTILPNSDHDEIEIEFSTFFSSSEPTWAIRVFCNSPYKLPGMVVQALAMLEECRRDGKAGAKWAF